jgi:hypothetical protein
MSLDEFNNLSAERDLEAVLTDAYRTQQEEGGRRRGRPAKRERGERRSRVDYTSLEHAGEPHRARMTDVEKEYVRYNVAEVNRRRKQTAACGQGDAQD